MNTKTLFLLLVILNLISCKKQELEPIGFVKADYVTNPDEAQVFNYYYDDGKYIGYGLKQYVASIITQENSFSKEQLMIMNFKRSNSGIPDSLSLYTYVLSTNYYEELNYPAEFRINLNYMYDNFAHTSPSEKQFFEANINKLKLYKFEVGNNEEFYYDPKITVSEMAFEIDSIRNDVVFYTKDLRSMYAFCLKEESWTDTINFSINGNNLTNDMTIIEKGFWDGDLETHEGAFLNMNTLQLQYTSNEQYFFSQSNQNGWQFENLFIDIINPHQGIINNADVNLNLLVSDAYNTTHLSMVSLTKVELIDWPDFGEYGKLKISGVLKIDAYLTSANVELIINFKRQR